MFCTNCEFEIQGEGREECPICGGSLIDFSSLDPEAQEKKTGAPEEKQPGSPQEPTDAATFDLASLLNDAGEEQKQEPGPETPRVEELTTEDFGKLTFEKAGGESDTSTSEPKEPTLFDLESALTTDDGKYNQEPASEQGDPSTFDFEYALNEDGEKPSREPEEPAQTSFTSKEKPEPEPALEEPSTEELLRRIAEEYKPAEEEVIAPPEELEPVPTRSSRSIPAIAALAVLAFMAAIASVAYLTPQGKLSPVIGQLKTEAEKTIRKISHIVLKEGESNTIEKKGPDPSVHPEKAQPDKSVEMIALYKEPPALEKTPLLAENSTVENKAESTSSDETVTEELTQPQTDSAEEIPPPLQEKSSPQTIEDKEKAPAKHSGTKGTRKNLYSLHTGSFTKESIASAESERLKRMGFDTYIQKVSLENGQTWYRVKVGSFSIRKDAEAIQDQLNHKAPHIKSYIMRKRVPSKTGVAGGVADTPKEFAIIDPAVSAHRKKTPSHEKPDVVETTPPVKETVTAEEALSPEENFEVETEQIQPEMDRISDLPQPMVEAAQEPSSPAEETYSPEEAGVFEAEQTAPVTDMISDLPQPVVEAAQESSSPAEEAYSPEEAVAHEEEIIREIDQAPYFQETIEEETTLEDTVSIETLPAEIPEQEDQASVTMDIFPGMGVRKGQEAITPVE